MRPGGQKDKGSAFEREAAKRLSLWLTFNERPDIFSRNVLSGGSFTLAKQAGKQTSRMPGDLMPAHPLAFQFLSRFSVECKHLQNIGLEAFLYDPRAKTNLGLIIQLARRQAKDIGLEFMVIAKQNRREPFVFMRGEVGSLMMDCLRKEGRLQIKPMHHFFHHQQVCGILLCDLVKYIDPDAFLTSATLWG